MKCESMGNGFFFPGDVHGGYLGMHVRSRRSVCVCARAHAKESKLLYWERS